VADQPGKGEIHGLVHGLPPAPPGAGYQFWFICADGMARGSEILVARPGSMMFTTGMPETGGAVLGAALTVEPLHHKIANCHCGSRRYRWPTRSSLGSAS